MSVPFVAQLCSKPGIVRLAPEGAAFITVRVEVLEVWDTVRIEVSPRQPVLDVKLAALRTFLPKAEYPEDFVMKLRGWEVLDESAPLEDAGAIDGSIFLLTYRRRQPVR